ncbi:protein of unknown function DUF885 [alpha proteobacterium U9-1i]|nr:protein of unknown function DUF885 [alpha proteobacterium U9-1i]
MFRSGLLAAFVFFTAAGAAGAQPRGDTRLNALLAEYERIDRRSDPITSGQEGDRAALSRLPDVTPEFAAARRAALADVRMRLERLNPRQLSPDAATNRAFLIRVIDDQIQTITFDDARIVFTNDSGFFTEGDFIARTTPIQSREDADAWLARMEALPRYYADNIANGRRGIATGLTQPRVVVDRAIAIARAQAAVAPAENSLLLPFATMPTSIPLDAQAYYRARALEIVRDQIAPAQNEVVAFLEREYLPAARPALGIRSVPNGEDYYRFLVRFHTTTNMTPEEIHALGQSEVARIRTAMEGVMREVGFGGTFAQFQNFLRTDPQFYARRPEELLEKASEIAKRADDQLPRLFGTLPRLPYGVRPVPADIAEGYTTGRYWPGSPTLGVAGGYMVNTARLDQRPLYELPALTVHEAAPGHHLQIALAQELDELPYFRRTTFVTAFVEGWGLYSETLGEEMGIYRTPYERFGRLSYEMWRACRLVADTGLHWMGWSLAEARRCFDENSALAPHNITTELERYVADPGQALAYKIGELALLRMRREAEAALGERFDVRAFHDVVLGGGSLPLDVLQQRVSAWAQARDGD